MAATEVAFSIFSSTCPSTSSKFPPCPRLLNSIKLHVCTANLPLCIKSSLYPFSSLPICPTKKPSFQVFSAVEDVAVEDKTEQAQENNQKRKLFVLNFPWSFSVVEIKNLFGECGTVTDVEIIKQKNGKSRGFAFVTMASGEEAHSELSGRIIRVELAKRFKKPSREPPVNLLLGETSHELYLSNLAWKSIRKSSGFGFVSFANKDQAEAAISALDGKELLSKPVQLKFSQRNSVESESKMEETTEKQPEDP